MRLDFAVEQVRANQPNAAVGHDKAVGDEIVVGMVDREVENQAVVILDRLDGGDALPNHALRASSGTMRRTELIEGRKSFSDAA